MPDHLELYERLARLAMDYGYEPWSEYFERAPVGSPAYAEDPEAYRPRRSVKEVIEDIEGSLREATLEARRVPSLEKQLEVARNARVSWQGEHGRAQGELDDYHSENPTEYDTYQLRLDVANAKQHVEDLRRELTETRAALERSDKNNEWLVNHARETEHLAATWREELRTAQRALNAGTLTDVATLYKQTSVDDDA